MGADLHRAAMHEVDRYTKKVGLAQQTVHKHVVVLKSRDLADRIPSPEFVAQRSAHGCDTGRLFILAGRHIPLLFGGPA